MSIIDFSVDEVTGAQKTTVGGQRKTFMAIAICLTALTLGAWYVSQYFFERRRALSEMSSEMKKDV